MSQIILDTEQVLTIAAQIESDNRRLEQLLNESKTAVAGLSAVWTGRAADETRMSYETFANRFFQRYYDILDQYVKFLRQSVAMQYEQTEQTNIRLADAFR